jgi:hypothetical protein
MAKIKAFCVTTKFMNKKQYVLDSIERPLDKKHVVEVTEDINKSKPFESADEATEFIGNIHNPFEKEFAVAEFTVPSAAFIRKPQQGELL